MYNNVQGFRCLNNQPNILQDFPIDVFKCRVPTFCHPFFINDTKKLIAIVMFCLKFSSPVSTFPIAVPKQDAFFDWNLTVCLTSSILFFKFYPQAKAMGNLPNLTKTLPNNLVTCFATESEARRISYFLAHFLIFVLSLLKALSPSTSMYGMLLVWAYSIWAALAITQTWNRNKKYSNFIIGFMWESD